MQEKGCKRRENMVQSGQREQKKEVFTYDTTGKKKRAFERNSVEKAGTPHFEAYYCPTATEAIEKVLSLIPEGSSITWGGSMTIRDMG